VYDLSNTRQRQSLLLQVVAIGAVAVATIGLLEAANVRPVVGWLAGFRYQSAFSIGEIPRVSSTLPHPNVAAMLLEMAVPLLVVWLVTTRRRSVRIGATFGTAVALAALVLTLSRAGVIFMEVVLGLLLVIGFWQRQPLLTSVTLCAIVGLPVLVGVMLMMQPVLRLHLTTESTDGWYSAEYSTPSTFSAPAGEAATVPIHVANTGSRTWSAGGEHPFALSYHLDDADGTPVTFDGPRTPLPHDVEPGASVDVQAQLVAPQSPGNYVVEWDEVQESVTWFSWNGTPSPRTYLTVVGPRAGTVAETIPQSPAPAELSPPPPGRLTLWRIALRMARDRPLLGIGPDNFRWRYGDYAGVVRWDTGVHANSVYFEWLADTGVPGLAAFLWLAWSLLRESARGLPRRRLPAFSGTWWVWRLALLASLIAWFLHGTLDYFYEPLPANLAFCLMAGLALSATRVDTSVCA
jgi:O-antigen ligase